VIGSLRGKLVAKRPPWLMLEVAGVGYELEAPMSTFYRLPEIGSELTLVTHLVVREDSHALYGFLTEAERALFRSLLKVSGVGARIGLGVLSGMSVEGFCRSIREKDLASLTRIPGVGRKTAERLLVEMPDRLPDAAAASGAGPRANGGAKGEAEEALLALGYKPAEVERLMRGIDADGLTTEQLIREALRRVHVG